MRDGKFRGKRLDNGAWEYGDLIENQGRFFIYHATSETTIEDNDDGRIVLAAVEVNPATVGQYTGLKDKNGKDIWEGDICQYEYTSLYDGQNKRPNKPFTVAWNSQEACFCGWDGFDYSSMPNVNRMVFIGNIHDNPELLKTE